MRASALEFRYRLAISTVIYVLGFWAPWLRFGPTAQADPIRLWSWLAISFARTGLLTTGNAYIAITVFAIIMALLGAVLRLFGTAYLERKHNWCNVANIREVGFFLRKKPVRSGLPDNDCASTPGRGIVFDKALRAESVVAAGPYRHVRNPLYLGSLLTACAISVLMPVSGAVFFLVALFLFVVRLAGGEEAFLQTRIGDAYLEYLKRVPRWIPSLSPKFPASPVQPRWTPSLAGEAFHVGFALCLLAFAWNYDAALLTRCVLICFGISLVLRALR